ncbi:hypothetical protein BOTCAL_0400g00030 [Botryotinia calthae]|uniref:Uncharacterized protein n=1 Tax=Botryotinia calthae TaxID=38488 RepID=A0A4Y8CR22_9HELO|nr:hypothetical protein BOTCAL_0400g00030 [Botryotinia calthae]
MPKSQLFRVKESQNRWFALVGVELRPLSEFGVFNLQLAGVFMAAELSTFELPDQFQTSPHQLPPNKMGASTITVTNNSTTDVSVSVTYDGNDFQKGGSEQWYTLKANGGSDTWNYRAGNQIARVARSQNGATRVESYLAVPGQTINIY